MYYTPGDNDTDMKIISLREHPDRLEQFISFFHSHWHSEAVYRDCMTACLTTTAPLPQWYLLVDERDNVVAGCGLITNDFNARQDLWPWVCALFVEKTHRGHGLGSWLLEHCRNVSAELGFFNLYLATDHIGYYEKSGFEFIGYASDPFGGRSRIYRISTSPVAAAGIDKTAERCVNPPSDHYRGTI